MLPPFLQKDDEIRIISPSGSIDRKYIDGAKRILSGWGLNVTEGKYARGSYGRFGGTAKERIEDLQEALNAPDVKAILCSRGGYGVPQIIDSIDFLSFDCLPKWIIGFSDITVLHNAISKLGIASIHAVMAKHLTELPFTAEPITHLRNILFGKLPAYSVYGHQFNRPGTVKAKIVGGNLSVLCGMRATPFDLNYTNNILLIEDIGEKPYQVDRMLQNLRLSGVLSSISGLIVGQFSDYEEDYSMKQTLLEIIANNVRDYDYPVCFNFPAGHEKYNLPVILNAEATLIVSGEKTILKYC